MSNKFAIYSGSTLNSVPPKFYWKNQKYKNLVGYAKTLEDANKKYNLIALKDNSMWVQIICLTTFNIIKQQISIDINKPLFEGYYSDDDYN
jgi:16S rRNA G527 N7-methylase RsmG